jgi:predicted transposase/invertase (TIGR01784 family)
MEIHVLNLERLPAEGEGRLMDWLRFLKAETEEEFNMLAEKNPVIREAYCKLQVMSEDEANRTLYEARLKAQRDEYSRVQGTWQEGRTEGRSKSIGIVPGFLSYFLSSCDNFKPGRHRFSILHLPFSIRP